ncbi:Glycosyltransferase sugar-binding region containing DXD motif-containing protein [Devosia enhydra]|uniref:Glycosyltransferase sugar-binding region containing DXD motif-containing protein n=1 Tax=Devosia enhydra TaxID=665118 RepID=A0A1K2I237_9HYPH|nr:glycosyltransferase [Devosia enhydra]SFZ86283.1 Glycosyltransferase sugar-binding region containing DXD motif-containing protein [Devosia enhydra]
MSIPKIFHFTWKGSRLPAKMAAILEKWKSLHPDWEFRFYDDAGLRDFVAREFPEQLALYDAYPRAIQRVDVFRYMVLSRVGGVYSDLDVEPYEAIDTLAEESACFLGIEPQFHMRKSYNQNGLPYLLCNAFMGSEPGHPLWDHVIAMLPRCQHGEVLTSTGPWFLTGAGLTAPDAARPDVLSPDYWSPITYDGSTDKPTQDFISTIARRFTVRGFGQEPICSHLWHQTWVGFGMKDWNEKSIVKAPSRLKWRWRKWRHPEIETMAQSFPHVRADYDEQSLKPVDTLPRIRIATPVKDAEAFLPAWKALVETIDYPPELLSVHLLVSDSVDGTLAACKAIAAEWSGRFASVEVTEQNFGFFLGKTPRWRRRIQLRRRGILGACRTAMAKRAAEIADYCLFLDVDLTEMPPDGLRTMLAARRPVVMANCLDQEGKVFDQNAFLYVERPDFYYLYRYGALEGLLQPPSGNRRHYLPDLAYLNITPLDAVGGTMLLVDCDVFRAGVVFPSEPYKLHIETEGFGLMARDHGFEVCGLPGLIVVHPRHD